MRAREDMLPWDELKPILENLKREVESVIMKKFVRY